MRVVQKITSRTKTRYLSSLSHTGQIRSLEKRHKNKPDISDYKHDKHLEIKLLEILQRGYRGQRRCSVLVNVFLKIGRKVSELYEIVSLTARKAPGIRC